MSEKTEDKPTTDTKLSSPDTKPSEPTKPVAESVIPTTPKPNPYALSTALENDKAVLAAAVAAMKTLDHRTTGTILPPAQAEQLASYVQLTKDQINALRPAVESVMYWQNFKNATYVTGSIIMTYIGTKLGFGFLWVVIMLFFVGGAFWRNMSKVKRRLRNEIKRELAYNKLLTDSEPVEWLNLFLNRFWITFEPELSDGIATSVNNMLGEMKISGLDDIRLSEFTLGSSAPRIENIRSYPSVEDDQLIMDWDLNFCPFDEDLISRRGIAGTELRNSKIELVAKVGKGIASIPIPILLEGVELSGVAQVRMKFMTKFPYIQTVQFGFMQPPKLDFVLRPLKGMDLMDTPGLQASVSAIVDAQLASMLVYPTPMTFDIAAMMGPAVDIDRPVGILYLVIFEAKELKNQEKLGVSDPYARVLIGGKVVAKTSTALSTLTPYWGNTLPIIITKTMLAQLQDGSDKLEIEVMDYNNIGKDAQMGITKSLNLARWIRLLESDTPNTPLNVRLATTVGRAAAQLEDDPPLTEDERESLITQWGHPSSPSNIWKKIINPSREAKGGKNIAGQIQLDMTYIPIFDPEQIKLALPPGTPAAEPLTHEECPSGIVTITLHQAKDLAATSNAFPTAHISLIGGGEGAGTHFLEYMGTGPKPDQFFEGAPIRPVFKTPTRKRTNNPLWGSVFSFFVSDVTEARLKFDITDDRDAVGGASGNKSLGNAVMSIVEILTADATQGADWFSLYNAKTGKVQVSAKFTPVSMDGSGGLGTSRARRAPLGILRMHMIEAKGLWNAEASTFGKSDPFAKLTLANVPVGQTHFVNNSLDPTWNEIFYAVVYSRREHLILEVLDDNDVMLDVSLGKVDFVLSELLEGKGFDAVRKKKVQKTITKLVKKKVTVQKDGKDVEEEVETEESVEIEEEAVIVPGEDPEADALEQERLLALVRPDFEMYKRDGLKLSKTPLKSDIWAPLYLAKEETVTAGDKEEGESKKTVVGGAQQLAKGTTNVAKNAFNIVNPLKIAKNVNTAMRSVSEMGAGLQGSSKQKGSIHFGLEFFPIVPDVSVPLIDQKFKSAALMTKESKDLLKKQKEKAKLGLDDEEDEPKVADRSTSPTFSISSFDKLADRMEKAQEILHTYSAGVEHIKVHEVKNLAQNGNIYFNIIRNDEEHVFTSRAKVTSNNEQSWNVGSDVFIRDTSADKICIEVRLQAQRVPSENDKILGVWEGPASQLVGLIHEELPLSIKGLVGPGAVGKSGVITVSAAFVPVQLTIAESEKAEKMGILNVDVIGCKNLPSGTNEAFCVFTINDEQVHQTKIQKKTLNPQFDETFQKPIPDRLRATLNVKVKDRNMLTKNVTIGEVDVPLLKITPGVVETFEYPIRGSSNSILILRLFFDPQKIAGVVGGVQSEGEKSAIKKLGKGLTTTLVSGVGSVGSTIGGKKKSVDHISSLEAFSRKKSESPVPQSPTESKNPTLPRVDETKVVESTPANTDTSETTSSFEVVPKDEISEGPSEGGAAITVEDVSETDKSTSSTPLPDSEPKSRGLSEASRFSMNFSHDSLSRKSVSSLAELDGKGIVGKMRLSINSAKDLKAVDAGGTSDPYVKVSQNVGGQVKSLHKTSVVKKNLNPKWNSEVCTFNIYGPPIMIHFLVKDQNTFGSNVDIGEADLDVFELVSKYVTANSPADHLVAPANGIVPFNIDISIGQGSLNISGEITLTQLVLEEQPLILPTPDMPRAKSRASNNDEHDEKSGFGFGKFKLGKKNTVKDTASSSS